VNRPAFGLHHGFIVNRNTHHVQHPPQRRGANGNGYRLVQVKHLHSAFQAFRRAHRDTANGIVAQMLCNFAYQRFAAMLNRQRVIKRGQRSACELYVQYRTDNLGYSAFVLISHNRHS
jgi:hypothetical protein